MGSRESSAPHQDPGRDWPGVLPPPPGTEHGAPTLLGFCDHEEIPPWLQTPSREAAWDTIPSPTSSIIPALRGRGLCPGKEHLMTWEGLPGRSSVTFSQAAAQDMGLPAGVPHNLSWQRPPLMSGAHKWHLASMSSVISKVLGPDPGSQSLCLVRVPLCPEFPLHPPQGLQGN